jgi:F-type H+-transporting ATPase subunit delta
VRTGTQGAARRVARAVLDVAEKQGDPAAVRDGLRQAAEVVHDHPELRAALSHPGLAAERRRKMVAAVFAFAPELVRRVLDLLVAERGLALLGAIEESYSAQWNARRGAIAARVITAAPLDPALVRALGERIHEATGLEAELSEKTDPAVLGGVLLEMGGRTYDGTVRGRLHALRRALQGDTRS